jgi:hypothetical protein
LSSIQGVTVEATRAIALGEAPMIVQEGKFIPVFDGESLDIVQILAVEDLPMGFLNMLTVITQL